MSDPISTAFTKSIFQSRVTRRVNHYPWITRIIKSMHDMPWTHHKFDFRSDVQDYKTKMDPERQVITTRCLSATAQVETGVKTFWGMLGDNLPDPHIRDMGYVFANIEVIHNEAYERLLKELNMEEIFDENMKVDVIRDRVEYLSKHNHRYYADSKKQFLYSLILFTLYVENVSLFGQFYIINYFKAKENMLKDASQMTAYTAREETLHAMGGMALINEAWEEHPELFDDELLERVHNAGMKSFKAELKILRWILGDFCTEFCSVDIVAEMLKKRFNECVTGIRMKPLFLDLDEKLLAKSKWFEDDIMADKKTDFFWKKPTEYAMNGFSRLDQDLF